MQKNEFYILRSCERTALSTVSHDPDTGESQTVDNIYGYPYRFSWRNLGDGNLQKNVNRKLIIAPSSIIRFTAYTIIMYDINGSIIGNITSYSAKNKIQLDWRTASIDVNVHYPEGPENGKIWFYVGYEVVPHYKKLELQNKKESGQMFFRESLNGTVTLFGDDYRYVKNTRLEQNLLFAIYRNDKLIAKNVFNKTDCKFDYFKYSVELKLSPEDRYTNILDKYDHTYDIIKLAPDISRLILRMRLAYQIYIAGANNITTVSAGTYWEDDVDEPISDETELDRKYRFAKTGSFYEVHLDGFNYDINATYIVDKESSVWEAIVKVAQYEIPANITFTKVRDAGTPQQAGDPAAYMLSDGTTIGTMPISGTNVYIYDAYRIEIYILGTKIYQSNYFYCADDGFLITPGENTYPMTKISQPSPYKEPIPATFNLGDNIIEYQVFCRIVCGDIGDTVVIDGVVHTLYDLPRDDFAYPRANYKKCIGLAGITLHQARATSTTPTKYGMDDYKDYFSSNFLGPSAFFYGKPIPISRSAWANTSIWVTFNSFWPTFEQNFEKEYTLKDAYDLADVISAMLAQIDPNIKHEGTAEYSQFLYSGTSPLGVVDENRNGSRVYITPKSNVLKGNYDQAAQKAELTFEQLMNMLRDCFRCYWFIDENNRFRIEHVSYFLNGMSYGSQSIQFDLTTKYDKFNKKEALYCQQEVEYEKSDLTSRFEFGWMDDCTDLFGNNSIDVNSEYIAKNETKDVNADVFSSDVDLMLCAPDKFSSDGFALLLAGSTTHRVIIGADTPFKDSDYNLPYYASPQNFLASWLYLVRYYMYDMSARNISFDGLPSNAYFMTVKGIEKCMKHEIEFVADNLEVDINKLITTEIGNGYIEEMSTNIDTDMTKIELRYEPS